MALYYSRYGTFDYYNLPVYKNMYGQFQAATPVAKHICMKTSTERTKAFYAGVVKYHERSGVDVSKLEEVRKEPVCVLSRISK